MTHYSVGLVAILLGQQSISGMTLLTETDSFDFSNDFQNPTEFVLSPGSNILRFTIGGPPNVMGGATNGSDADFVLFRLAPGQSVTSIRSFEPQTGAHFFGTEYGDRFTFAPVDDPNSDFAQSLDGGGLFGGLFLELTDKFPNPDRTFAALFQENSGGRSPVALEVIVVPEPSAALLLVAGICPLLRRKRTTPLTV